VTNYIYTKKNTNAGTIFSYTGTDGIVWWFTEAPGNKYYEDYLEWLSEGNEPEVVE
jgi:hypothetical protein